MSQPLLSILIPTTPDRKAVTFSLIEKIIGPYGGYDSDFYKMGVLTCARYVSKINPIELLVYLDDRHMTLGEKREMLYNGSKGLYSWQIDSDDDIAPEAVSLILDAIKHDADCITFKEKCIINGTYYASDHQLHYEDWAENVNGFDYVRTPFYKDVIKTEIAKSVPFEHIRYGEDHAWARALKPHLKTSYYIDLELYYYIHNSKPEDHNERYGIV